MNFREVIEAARDRHPSFDVQTHPDKICHRFLNVWSGAALQRALIRYPDLYDDGETVIPLPLDDFAEGYAIPQLMLLQGAGEVTIGQGKMPFTLIPYSHRKNPMPPYSGWFINSTLYLAGREQDWNGASEIRLRWTTPPAESADMGDEMILPDTAKEAATTACASFMANRQLSRSDVPPPDPMFFKGLADQAEESWMQGLWNLSSANITYIRDEF